MTRSEVPGVTRQVHTSCPGPGPATSSRLPEGYPMCPTVSDN